MDQSLVNLAAREARCACEAFAGKKIREREEVIRAIRLELAAHVAEIAEMTFKETGMGVIKDKIEKLLLVIAKTPGTEDLITEVYTTDDGLTLYELSPYGVVCAVHPCNNPAATLINTTISCIAAGNAVIHCPHPRAVQTSDYIVSMINRVVKKTCGIENLVVNMKNCSMAATDEIMSHPDVDCIIITGSDTAISHAMRADKKVIGAGPANPPVIVDATADVFRAAQDIVHSASFDNNLLCVSEKAIVAEESIADALLTELAYNGAQVMEDVDEVVALSKAILDEDMMPNKVFNGRNASDILMTAGIPTHSDTRLIVVPCVPEHPFVTSELLMPVVPLVRARDFDEAMKMALQIEQGNHHTAVIHSQSIKHLNYAARVMQTSVFVKNGPATAGIGYQNDGPCSFSVATRTGEGTVTARHFGRRRRCTLMSAFTIR